MVNNNFDLLKEREKQNIFFRNSFNNEFEFLPLLWFILLTGWKKSRDSTKNKILLYHKHLLIIYSILTAFACSFSYPPIFLYPGLNRKSFPLKQKNTLNDPLWIWPFCLPSFFLVYLPADRSEMIKLRKYESVFCYYIIRMYLLYVTIATMIWQGFYWSSPFDDSYKIWHIETTIRIRSIVPWSNFEI